MRTLVYRIAFHMKGARRASICPSMSFACKGIGDGGRHSVERSTQLLFLTWSGVGLDGSAADQGRTGRKDSSSRLWCPARSLGTHAKQSPSTGHSAVGLRQAGNSLLTPRPHFTAPSCTLGNQVVGASDGGPYRQERRPTSSMPNSRGRKRSTRRSKQTASRP